MRIKIKIVGFFIIYSLFIGSITDVWPEPDPANNWSLAEQKLKEKTANEEGVSKDSITLELIKTNFLAGRRFHHVIIKKSQNIYVRSFELKEKEEPVEIKNIQDLTAIIPKEKLQPKEVKELALFCDNVIPIPEYWDPKHNQHRTKTLQIADEKDAPDKKISVITNLDNVSVVSQYNFHFDNKTEDAPPISLKRNLKFSKGFTHSKGCPKECPLCLTAIDKSLKYLASDDTSGVSACLAGLAFLAGGNTLTKGAYAEVLAKCNESAQQIADRDSKYRVWEVAYAIIFLCELYQVDPSDQLKAKIIGLVSQLQKYQRSSGGWQHSSDHVGGEGYAEAMTVTTTLSLLGLALAKRTGCEVNEKSIQKGIKYLERAGGSQGGGLFYQDKGGQAEVARTAAGILSLMFLDQEKTGLYRMMVTYVSGNSFKFVLDANSPYALYKEKAGDPHPPFNHAFAAIAFRHLIDAKCKVAEPTLNRLRNEILEAQDENGAITPPDTTSWYKQLFVSNRKILTAIYAIILQSPLEHLYITKKKTNK